MLGNGILAVEDNPWFATGAVILYMRPRTRRQEVGKDLVSCPSLWDSSNEQSNKVTPTTAKTSTDPTCQRLHQRTCLCSVYKAYKRSHSELMKLHRSDVKNGAWRA